MSGDCYPDILMGDVPHFYLYYCGNPAEATIAKRRSHAALIGYQPPVFVQSGLYGEYARLSAMLDDYHHQLAFSENAAKEVMENIVKLAKELNLPTDSDELESELYRMNSSLIPKGLHIFGMDYSEEEALTYVRQLLNSPHDDIASLRDLAAEELGIKLSDAEEKCDTQKLSEINNLAGRYFDEYFSSDESPIDLQKLSDMEKKNTMRLCETWKFRHFSMP